MSEFFNALKDFNRRSRRQYQNNDPNNNRENNILNVPTEVNNVNQLNEPNETEDPSHLINQGNDVLNPINLVSSEEQIDNNQSVSNFTDESNEDEMDKENSSSQSSTVFTIPSKFPDLYPSKKVKEMPRKVPASVPMKYPRKVPVQTTNNYSQSNSDNQDISTLSLDGLLSDASVEKDKTEDGSNGDLSENTFNKIAAEMKNKNFNKSVYVPKRNDYDLSKEFEKVQTKINNFLVNSIEGYYIFMTLFGKQYKPTVTDPLDFDDTDAIVDFNKSIQPDQITRGLINIAALSPVHPNIEKSSYKSLNLIGLERVVPVGVTGNLGSKSPMFYCILGDDEDNSNNEIFVKNLISYNVTKQCNGKYYYISKCTDRVTMRLKLRQSFQDDENRTNFSLFLLENTHLIAVNRNYIISTDNYVILALNRLVNDVFDYFDQFGRLLDYDTMINNVERKGSYLNRPCNLLGIKTPYGTVIDSNTIAYCYWMYILGYFKYSYTDRTWVLQNLRITTTKDSNNDALVSYQISNPAAGKYNMFTVDSTVDFNRIYSLFDEQGLNEFMSFSNNSELNMTSDLRYYISTRNENEKQIIYKYINGIQALSRFKFNFKLDLYIIYPLIYSVFSNSIGYISGFVGFLNNSLNFQENGKTVTMEYISRLNKMEIYDISVDRSKSVKYVKQVIPKVEYKVYQPVRTYNKVCGYKGCNKSGYVKEELPPKVEYKVYQPVKTDFSKQVSSTHLPTYGNGNSIKVSVDDNVVEPVKYKIYKPVRTYKKGACKSLINNVYYKPEVSTVFPNVFNSKDYDNMAWKYKLLLRFRKEYYAYKDLIDDTIGLMDFLKRRDSGETLSSIIQDCKGTGMYEVD